MKSKSNMASRNMNWKGKEVDWKATMEMLSSSTNTRMSEDEDPADHTASVSINANYRTISDDPEILDDLPVQMRHEPAGGFEAMRLLYDPDEIQAIKNRRLRGPAKRSAPPPPIGAILRAVESAQGSHDPVAEVAAEETNKKIDGFKGTGGQTKRWDPSNAKTPASQEELKSMLESKKFELDSWECHECSLIHPIIDDGGVLDTRDPNVCKCCNHDRCGKCWDLNENGWRVKKCDGSSLE